MHSFNELTICWTSPRRTSSCDLLSRSSPTYICGPLRLIALAFEATSHTCAWHLKQIWEANHPWNVPLSCMQETSSHAACQILRYWNRSNSGLFCNSRNLQIQGDGSPFWQETMRFLPVSHCFPLWWKPRSCVISKHGPPGAYGRSQLSNERMSLTVPG